MIFPTVHAFTFRTVFIPEFYKLVHNLEDRLEKVAANTKLPKKPDFHKIEKVVMEINEEYLQE